MMIEKHVLDFLLDDRAQFATRMGRRIIHARDPNAFWSNLADVAMAASTFYSILGIMIGSNSLDQDLEFLSGM